MKVKLVYGPAKSGKTRYVVKSFIDNIKKNPVLIVPSAETIRCVKRSILSQNDLAGFCGRRILTFDNLVNILTEGLGELSYIGKTYLLRDIISELDLKYFLPVKNLLGFYEVLGAFISELKQGQIMPEDFLNGLKKKGLTDKDRELSAIYSVYQERLNKLNLYDHEGKFWQAQSILENTPPEVFKDCRLLLVDGFQNFSPTELKIIQAFGNIAGEVIITLTLSKNKLQEDLFIPTLKTYNQLKKTFGKCEELSLPEKKDGVKNIRVIANPGQSREAEEIAKQTKELIYKHNRKPGNIAVLFRNLTPYKDLIVNEFKRYGIPYSISEGFLLKNSPVIRCIMGLFEIILGNWSWENVFNFLKSNYVVYRPYMDADKTGEVCRKAGIIEGRQMWRERLNSRPEKYYISGFLSMVEELEKSPAPSVLRKLIMNFGIENQIAECMDPERAKHEISAYSKFMDGLRELDEKKITNLKSFYEYLNMMINTLEYSVRTDTSSGVQIMDVHRARGLSFPIVFIGGLLEGDFPGQIQEGPFYSDIERTELRRFGINTEDAKERQNEEIFLFYSAVHTAGDIFYLTYPATDNEGKEEIRSHYIDQAILKKCGINAEIETKTVHISGLIPQFDSVYTKDYLFPRIMLSIWKETEPAEGIALYNRLIKEKSPVLGQLISNSFIEERECGILSNKPILEKLSCDFGKDYAFSISQFNEYGACPFSYFCKRLLHLEPIEPPEEEITPKDEGNLYHAVLWEFYTDLREFSGGNILITTDDTEELISKIYKILDKHFRRAEKEGLVNNTALWQIKKSEVIKNLKNIILYEAQNTNFYRKPAYFEISFGMKEKPFTDKASVPEPLVFDTVKIQGKIDRIDIIEPNMFYVVDYKTGGSPVKLSDITSGKNFQLPVYILAVKNLILKDMEPFEGYFWHLKTKKYFHANPLSRYKGNKLNPGWDNYIESAIKYIKEYAKNIREGRFPLVPKDECPSYCDYKDICRK